MNPEYVFYGLCVLGWLVIVGLLILSLSYAKGQGYRGPDKGPKE